MGTTDPEQPRLIEGVGDEIVYGCLTLLALVLSTTLLLKCRWRRQPGIHPEFAATVESTRQQLNRQNSGTGDQRDQQHSQSQQPHTRHVNSGQLTCPICLGQAAYAVETNCGHLYCGQCFLTYWHHQNWLGAVPCPSCRTRATLLLLNFTTAEAAEGTGTPVEVRQGVHNYNRRFSGEPRTVMDYLRDLPTLLRHAWNDDLFSIRGVFFLYRLRFVLFVGLALVYLISPFDILSESALGLFGLLDDFIVLFLLFVYISIIYRRAVAARAEGT